MLKNATKFTKEGVIQLRFYSVKLLVTKNLKPIGYQDAVLFEVYDTRIGISMSNMKTLFKLFGKISQQDNQINKEGIGLGLYISERMIT